MSLTMHTPTEESNSVSGLAVDATASDDSSPSDLDSLEESFVPESWDPSYDRFGADTLEAMEWSRVTAYLSSLCRTVWGRSFAKHLPFFANQTEAERELRQVDELFQLLQEQGESLPMGSLADLRPAFVRLEKGAALDPSALIGVVDLLEAATRIREFVASFDGRLPSVWERAEILRPLLRLRRDIESVLERSGRLRDDASWELGSLRETVRSCHDRIRRKMQEYLSTHSRHLTDTYYTLRQDRYVLPVKASDRGKIPGIVYGSSGSGATVFVEPQQMVKLNNELRIAEQDVAQEEMRILRKLSERTAQELPVLNSNLELLRDLDVLQARVRMAQRFEASVPTLISVEDGAAVKLNKARHPLLLLKGIDVVPNDIALGEGGRTLLISGPNTGGKTVALKTLGLSVLMAQAGLPVPAEQGSVVPFFEEIFTDIGDHQSIEHDLSTFSAQIVKLRAILEEAHDRSLVLIDEIVVGTDPYQGAALATSILESLTDKRCFVVTTTHYEQLKALAYEDDRFVNASVGFDMHRLAPTYRLYLGTPGSSSALEIARRLGLDESLCERAEELLSPAGDRFDRIISKLEQQYQSLYEERERATKARKKIEKEALAQQRKSEQIESLEERLRSGEEQAWREQFRKARGLVREAVQTLQQDSTNWNQVQAAQRKLKEAEEQMSNARQDAQPAQTSDSPALEQVNVGQKVRILSLRMDGEVLEEPDANEMVLVQAGIMRTRVPVKELRPLSQRQSKKRPSRRISPAPTPQAPAASASSVPLSSDDTFSVLPTRENRCDLRGMRAEEALDKVDTFLANAMAEGRSAVLLIHGHGTGVLREAVRQHCRHSNLVKKYRPGERSEGGNGVTAVLLF